jgi:hypothetical protein
MGAEEWRESEDWPPEGVRDRPFYLGPGGTLGEEPPPEGAAPARLVFDPAHPAPTVGGHVLTASLRPGPQDQRAEVESRADALVYSTPPLEAPLEVAGKARVRIFAGSDGPDTDFTALLTDVSPDGRSMLVTEGIQRMRFREGADREVFMTPGETYEATIELTHTAITFLPGHRVRLVISSSNHPKYAVNRNDGGPMYGEGEGRIAANFVRQDGAGPSALILPVAGR